MNNSKFIPTQDELEFAKDSTPQAKVKAKSAISSKYAPTEDELEFAQESGKEKIKEEVNPFHSYINAVISGAAEGALDVSEMGYGLARAFRGGGTETEKQLKREEQEEAIEKTFPIEEEVISKGIKRGAKEIPGAILSEGRTLPALAKSAISGALGQAGEEKGYGATGQAILQTIPFVTPSLRKKIPTTSAKQKELIDFARKKGIPEEQIPHIMHEHNLMRERIANRVSAGKNINKQLEATKQNLGSIYESLKSSPGSAKKMDVKDLKSIVTDYMNEWPNIAPSERAKLEPVFKQLFQSTGTGEDFIRAYQHAYKEVSDPKVIGKLQSITRDALKKIDPDLGKDFELTNKLYENLAKTRSILHPPANPDILFLLKSAGALYGILSGDFVIAQGAIGAIAARKAASLYLTNPRFQNMGKRMVHAINSGKFVLANKIVQEMRDEAEEEAPEFADAIETFDAKSFNRQ